MQPALQPARAAVSATTPETERVPRAAAGEGAAFEVLMRRHNQLLFRTARSILEGLAREVDAARREVFAFDRARCGRITARVLASARAEGLNPRRDGSADGVLPRTGRPAPVIERRPRQ